MEGERGVGTYFVEFRSIFDVFADFQTKFVQGCRFTTSLELFHIEHFLDNQNFKLISTLKMTSSHGGNKMKPALHRQKCGSFESAITMSCGRLTMEANGKITKKVYGD